jgi:glyoxalase family protein
VLAGMGATLDLRIYPGMGHTVNTDEIAAARAILAPLAAAHDSRTSD